MYLQVFHEFDSDLVDYEAEYNPLTSLGPIGRVNVFVGATNAGKSRLLRAILRKGIYQAFGDESFGRHGAKIADLAPKLAKLFQNIEATLYWNTSPPREDAPDDVKLVVNYKAGGEPTISSGTFERLLTDSIAWIRGEAHNPNGELLLHRLAVLRVAAKIAANDVKDLRPHVLIRGSDLSPFADGLVQIADVATRFFSQPLQQLGQPHRIYIPVLRTAWTLNTAAQASLPAEVFPNAIRTNYRLPAADNKLQIFTGTELYDLLTRDSSGSFKQRRNVDAFKEFLARTFFDAQRVEIVPIAKGNADAGHILITIITWGTASNP